MKPYGLEPCRAPAPETVSSIGGDSSIHPRPWMPNVLSLGSFSEEAAGKSEGGMMLAARAQAKEGRR